MRIVEIEAFSIEEAKRLAEERGFNVVKNVTRTFNKSSESVTEFCKNTFESYKVGLTENKAFIIVKEAGSKDTKNKPFKCTRSFAPGKTKLTKVYEIRTAITDKYIGETTQKNEAYKLAASKMSEFKEKLLCKKKYKVDTAHELAFTMEYVPSKKTKLGKYIVFGN